jgi:hypothetical protein
VTLVFAGSVRGVLSERRGGMSSTERQLAMILEGLVLVGSSYAAPPVKKHAPDFTITIPTEEPIVKAEKTTHIPVTVAEKNTSHLPVNDPRTMEPGE